MKSWTTQLRIGFILLWTLGHLTATNTFAAQPSTAALSWITLSKDGKSFQESPGAAAFTPWGFNYDRDASGRLLEDYWATEWPAVETHFAQMKQLGANTVRVHLQFGKFMDQPARANQAALQQLTRLIKLAERERLYLNLTGLGCYHRADVPDWYDALSETERWQSQAAFWQAVATTAAASPAVFCYDLMNEPVVPGGARAAGEWLGPALAGKHYVQFITLDPAGRERPVVARQWIEQLVNAIRAVDRRHLITVGLVDWSLDRPGLSSGFVPKLVTDKLDFISVHLYPESGEQREAIETLSGFDLGKPLVIEETFPMKCSLDEMAQFITASRAHADGWISFYWGQPPVELAKSTTLADAILLKWLERFQELRSAP